MGKDKEDRAAVDTDKVAVDTDTVVVAHTGSVVVVHTDFVAVAQTVLALVDSGTMELDTVETSSSDIVESSDTFAASHYLHRVIQLTHRAMVQERVLVPIRTHQFSLKTQLKYISSRGTRTLQTDEGTRTLHYFGTLFCVG